MAEHRPTEQVAVSDWAAVPESVMDGSLVLERVACEWIPFREHGLVTHDATARYRQPAVWIWSRVNANG